jgi:hypothetical protein
MSRHCQGTVHTRTRLLLDALTRGHPATGKCAGTHSLVMLKPGRKPSPPPSSKIAEPRTTGMMEAMVKRRLTPRMTMGVSPNCWKMVCTVQDAIRDGSGVLCQTSQACLVIVRTRLHTQVAVREATTVRHAAQSVGQHGIAVQESTLPNA